MSDFPRYLSQFPGVDCPGLHLRDGSDPDALAALLGPPGVSHRMCQMPQRVSMRWAGPFGEDVDISVEGGARHHFQATHTHHMCDMYI